MARYKIVTRERARWKWGPTKGKLMEGCKYISGNGARCTIEALEASKPSKNPNRKKRKQKRKGPARKGPGAMGQSVIPVPKEKVLRKGKLPKGCRFPRKGETKKGMAMCSVAVAKRKGVIGGKKKSTKKSTRGRGPVRQGPGAMGQSIFPVPKSWAQRANGKLMSGCMYGRGDQLGTTLCNAAALRKIKQRRKLTARERAAITRITQGARPVAIMPPGMTENRRGRRAQRGRRVDNRR